MGKRNGNNNKNGMEKISRSTKFNANIVFWCANRSSVGWGHIETRARPTNNGDDDREQRECDLSKSAGTEKLCASTFISYVPNCNVYNNA